LRRVWQKAFFWKEDGWLQKEPAFTPNSGATPAVFFASLIDMLLMRAVWQVRFRVDFANGDRRTLSLVTTRAVFHSGMVQWRLIFGLKKTREQSIS
jgi:hypothetical protein